MTLEQVLLALHIAAAVLGLGQVGAAIPLALYARTRKGDHELAVLLRKLFGALSGSVGIMLLTGIGMDVVSHGAWHGAVFFQVGFLAAIAIGACSGIAGAKLKKIDAANEEKTLGTALMLARLIAGITFVTAVLMVVKPG